MILTVYLDLTPAGSFPAGVSLINFYFCRCRQWEISFSRGGCHRTPPTQKREGGGNASFFPHDERGKSVTSGGGCGNCGKAEINFYFCRWEKPGGGRGKVAGKSGTATAGKVAGKAEAASKTHSREVCVGGGKRNAGTRHILRERMAGEAVFRKNAGKMRKKKFFLFPFEI